MHRRHTPLSHAKGLGSAKEGIEHWWAQRVTAAALIPLTVWFIASLIVMVRSDYNTVIAWFREPLTTVLMVSLLVALFYHMALGLQVVIEDYVHSERLKIPTVVATRLVCFVLAVAGSYATLRIAFVV